MRYFIGCSISAHARKADRKNSGESVSRMTIEHGLTEQFTLDLDSLRSEVPSQLT